MSRSWPRSQSSPVFYLNQWANDKSRLLEFSRPYGDVVKARPSSPVGTGYVEGLYRLPGVSDELAEEIENKFFKHIDDFASYAHKKLLRKYMINWSPRMRMAWAHFIMGVLIRSPKAVADTKLTLAGGMPELWEEARTKFKDLGEYNQELIDRIALRSLQRFINQPALLEFIAGMRWSVCDLSKTKFRFLTSDRPIVMTDGLGYPESHLAVPVSPTILFLATNTEETERSIQSMHPKELVGNCNKQVVRHAIKYVWAPDHAQFSLIKAQMSSEAHLDRKWFKDYTGPPRELIPAAKKVVV
ncbi:hypothetical protein ABIB99_008461 [Bradyrhizobium sp. LA6.1]|uniref:DUF4238 domain-containing protein n=1 Tax=Bradyrhizobium sp. LA6.1 TaxID=3156378 RepID=UPI003397ECCC